MAFHKPAFVSQFGWGTQFDDENCVAACGCMLLDRQTGGAKRTNPPRVRALINNPSQSGGLSNTDLAFALKRGWDENIVNPLPFEQWSKFLAQVREGRGAVLFGDCAEKRGRLQCPGPKGELPPNHGIYIHQDDPAGGRMLTADPSDHTSASGWQWLSYTALARYGELWTKRDGYVNASYSSVTGDTFPDDPNDPTTPSPTDPLGCLGQLVRFLPK